MSETIPSLRFEGLLESEPGAQGVYIILPFDVSAVFGSRGRIPVRVTINGHVFRTSLAPYGGKHYLGVNRTVRGAAKVDVGDRVEVSIERDDQPRVINPPDDLANALADNPAALESWERLSYSHKKEFVDAIDDAKKPETRARRILKAVEELTGKYAKR